MLIDHFRSPSPSCCLFFASFILSKYVTISSKISFMFISCWPKIFSFTQWQNSSLVMKLLERLFNDSKMLLAKDITEASCAWATSSLHFPSKINENAELMHKRRIVYLDQIENDLLSMPRFNGKFSPFRRWTFSSFC